MEKVEFTEITSDSFIGNKIEAQETDTTISKDDLGLSDTAEEEGTVHVYIAFTDGVSIDQGIGIIEDKVCNGQSLQISRRDESSNAVVAIVKGADANSIEKLAEVSFIKIDRGAQKTTKSDDTTSESVQQTVESEADNKTTEIEETETSSSADTEDIEAVDDSDIASETTTEVLENNVDTNVKTVSPTSILVALILGLAILIGIILHRANR